MAQAVAQAAVVPLLPPPMAPAGGGFGVRQQTSPLPQLAELEQVAVVTVPAGQLATSTAQVNVLAPAPMPIPAPAARTVQHVGLGF